MYIYSYFSERQSQFVREEFATLKEAKKHALKLIGPNSEFSITKKHTQELVYDHILMEMENDKT